MKIIRRGIATLMACALIGGLLAIAAAPASAGLYCDKSPFSEDERRAAGFEEICGLPIVFSDAKTGDLWLTDHEGNGPIRLTNTPMIESNPAGLFPWVFYDGTTKHGADIYMMSLIDPGHGRIRVTGLKSDDWDPTAVSLFLGYEADSSSMVEGRPMAKGPGGLFYPVLLAYSSDRDANNKKCGIEIFAELFTLTGPERITACDRSDKLDPEWAEGAPWFAYEAWKWNGSPPQVRASDGLLLGDSEDFSVLATGMFPTWSPFCCIENGDGPDRDPQQPAGNENVVYTAPNGTLRDVYIDGSDDEFLAGPPSDNSRLGESEWDAFGYELVVNVYTNNKSWLALVGKGGVGPTITNKKKFVVQSMDFVSPTIF